MILDGLITVALTIARQPLDLLPVVSIPAQSFAGMSNFVGLMMGLDSYFPEKEIFACVALALVYVGVSIPFNAAMWLWRSIPLLHRG